MCAHPIQLKSQAAGERVPCGFCFECRARYRRGWALRCLHEASQHEENCYGTLTYDEENVPPNGSLVKRDHQLFMKRLRQFVDPQKVKYYLAGEYGELNKRPHYHFLLFGYRPKDFEALPVSGPFPLFRSAEMGALWPNGLSAFGDVSFASANYVAGYVMKKVDQVGRKKKYACDVETGRLVQIQAEYSAMSRGGREQLPDGSWCGGRGLGYQWYQSYGEEVERLGTVRADFHEFMPPRYYDTLLRERDASAYELVKRERLKLSRSKDVEARPNEFHDEQLREQAAREAMAVARQQLYEQRRL